MESEKQKMTGEVSMTGEMNRSVGKDSLEKAAIGILLVSLVLVGFNTFQISALKSISSMGPGAMAANSMVTGNAVAQMPSAVETGATALSGPDVIPKGIPPIYGTELGVSFDDVSAADAQKADATIKKIGLLDKQISLSGKDKERYIQVASRISCEYCCGTDSIIFSDGKAACGCAHSFAMRGLAKYLIKNHGPEYTDDAILEELGKWKTLFFPEKITAKAKVLQAKGIELNYVNLASNKYRGAENEGGA